MFIIMRMSLQKRELEISTKKDTVLAWKRRIPYKLFSFHSKFQFSFLFFSPANISVLMFNENIIFFADYRLISVVKDCSRGDPITHSSNLRRQDNQQCKHLKGQLGPPVSKEQVHVTFLLIPALAPVSRDHQPSWLPEARSETPQNCNLARWFSLGPCLPSLANDSYTQ